MAARILLVVLSLLAHQVTASSSRCVELCECDDVGFVGPRSSLLQLPRTGAIDTCHPDILISFCVCLSMLLLSR
jgi:hypothetical protein